MTVTPPASANANRRPSAPRNLVRNRRGGRGGNGGDGRNGGTDELDQFERSQWPFWTLLIGVFCVLMYLFSPVMMPFVMGMAIAYLMDPFVDRLEKRGLPRWMGTVLAIALFISGIAVLILLLLPLIQTQIQALVTAIPGYAAKLQTVAVPWAEHKLLHIAPDAVDRMRDAIGDMATDAVGSMGNVVKHIVTNGIAIFDILSLFVVTPVVAFYLLRDWDKIVVHIDGVLPRRHAAVIRAEADKIDETLSGFVHGQALVCLSLGAYYAIALTLAGLDFGATIGVVAGVLSFIPYVGTVMGFVCSLGLALIQFDDISRVLIIVCIYILGQVMEGNVISPKLVGDRIGLHPVWIIFAILAGGSLFGFLGVLVALPVAAVLGVLFRFALDQYMHSRYYLRR